MINRWDEALARPIEAEAESEDEDEDFDAETVAMLKERLASGRPGIPIEQVARELGLEHLLDQPSSSSTKVEGRQ